MSTRIKRRKFITLLGGAAAAWPLVARAQQGALPVIGFLRSTPAEPFANIVAAFRQGLNETGFIEGQNVAVDHRWADNQLYRLPGLAADLVRRQVAVIVGNGPAVEAARSATTTIPIVFVIGDDPVTQGLVTSLNRPGGNLTGLTFFGNRLSAKRLEMLLELVPGARVVAVLIDPNFSSSATELREVEEAGRTVERKIVAVKAGNEREFDAAFTRIVQAGADALVICGSPSFSSERALCGYWCQVQQMRNGSVQSFNRSRTGSIRNNCPRPGGHERNGYAAGWFAASLNNTGYRNRRPP